MSCQAASSVVALVFFLLHPACESSWIHHGDYNCWAPSSGSSRNLIKGNSGILVASSDDCRDLCDNQEYKDQACDVAVFRMGDKACFLRIGLEISKCDTSAHHGSYDWGVGFDMWARDNASSPQAPTPIPTTPAPVTPPSRPTPPPAPPGRGLGACKAGTKYLQEVRFCEEFYNADIGIAFTLLEMEAWHRDRTGKMDDAHFFADPPLDTFTQYVEQAMSITHYQKGSYGYTSSSSQLGVAMSISITSNFWRFFWACASPGGPVLAADCKDRSLGPFPGSSHIKICKPPYMTMAQENFTYEMFHEQKNNIVRLTGEGDCSEQGSWTYNEFDSNGLSLSGFRGFLISAAIKKPIPDDGTICSFAARKGLHGHDGQIPVWMYQPKEGVQSSELSISRYIQCGVSSLIV